MLLNKFQSDFKDLMLDHPDALNNPDPSFAAHFEEGDIPLARRLSVYRNNIVGSLTDIMLATFPLIEKLVGTEFLEMMARTFILQNPPTQGCLNFYGRGFGDFITGFELAAALPYLPDMARLEIAMNEAYYARDEQALTPEELAAVPPEALGDLRLYLCDCVQIVSSDYPLLDIKALCENPDGAPVNFKAGGDLIMVTRRDLQTELVKLNHDEYLVLRALQDGKALGEAVESALADYPNFDFQAFLQKHLALETFRELAAN